MGLENPADKQIPKRKSINHGLVSKLSSFQKKISVSQYTDTIFTKIFW